MKPLGILDENDDWTRVRISEPGVSGDEAWQNAEAVSKFLANVDCAGWYFSVMNGTQGIIMKIEDPKLALQVKLIYGK